MVELSLSQNDLFRCLLSRFIELGSSETHVMPQCNELIHHPPSALHECLRGMQDANVGESRPQL